MEIKLVSDLEDSELAVNVTSKGAHRFLCRCGREFGAGSTLKSVLSGNTKSCGCIKKESARLSGIAKIGIYTVVQQERSDARASIPSDRIKNLASVWGLELVGTIAGMVKTRDQIELVCRCKNHFSAAALDFVRGMKRSCGCLKSWEETEVHGYVASLAPDAIRNTRSVIPPLEVDIWVPSKRLAIEYNGLHWHGEQIKGTEARNDILRKVVALENAGARGLFFYEDEWLSKRSAVEGYIRSVLGKKKKVGARKCRITIGGADFIEANHIQGARRNQSTIALEYDGQIVAAASFSLAGSSRKGPGTSYELTRYCVGPEISVVGGLSKLLAEWRRTVPVDSIVTYSDRRYSVGALYREVGFSEETTSPPSYYYFKAGRKIRLHRFAFRRDELEKKGWLHPGDTEWSAMKRKGYDRVWDAGKIRWVLTK
jgi:hypothetical protein